MLSWHGRPAHVFRQKARTNFRAAAKKNGGAGILACLELVSGGHSCPPEPIRIRSAGQECPTLADSGRQECPPHQIRVSPSLTVPPEVHAADDQLPMEP